MYKYDKEKDCIVNQEDGIEAKVYNHDELQALREALGLEQRNEQKYTVQIMNEKDCYLNLSR